jgi:protein SCO1/2
MNLFAMPASAAQPLAPPQTEFVQHLDAALPLALPFVDAEGRAVHLRDYFGDGRAVLLVLGYYRCPNLCGLAMHGLLEALDASGVSRRDVRVLGVSIDPEETPADARARQRVDLDYAAALQSDRGAAPAAGALDLRLIVGAPAAIGTLAERVGFGFARDDGRRDAHDSAAARASRYAHPAGFGVVTPEGRVSRYLFGVRFEPRALRLALVEATAGRIGGLSDRLLLLCAHFDPATGRWSSAVMNLLRIMGLALVLLLGGWAWRHRRPPVREAPP